MTHVALLLAVVGCSSEPAPSTTSLIAEICASPERYDGESVELTLSGVRRTDPSCTAIACTETECCNQCDAYYVVDCPEGDGVLAFVQGENGFSCLGDECHLTCDPEVSPTDRLELTATVRMHGPPTPCCTPIRFGVPDAIATFDVTELRIDRPDAGS